MDLLLIGSSKKLFDAIASGTGNSTAYSLPASATQVTAQTIFGTAPASITVQIQTSLDNSNWTTVASSTNVNGETLTFNTSALYIRARINAISGGDAITVIVVPKRGTINDSLVATSDTQVLFNSLGTVTGSSDLTFSGNDLSVGGDVTAGGVLTAATIIPTSAYKSVDGSTGDSGTADNTNTLTIKNGLVTHIA